MPMEDLLYPCRQNAKLVFSYVGYLEQEFEVSAENSNINIKLEARSSALNEVVVTALGIERKKKSLTYSTQSVDVKPLTEVREPNVMTSLQGKVAGLTVTEGASGIALP